MRCFFFFHKWAKLSEKVESVGVDVYDDFDRYAYSYERLYQWTYCER